MDAHSLKKCDLRVLSRLYVFPLFLLFVVLLLMILKICWASLQFYLLEDNSDHPLFEKNSLFIVLPPSICFSAIIPLELSSSSFVQSRLLHSPWSGKSFDHECTYTWTTRTYTCFPGFLRAMRLPFLSLLNFRVLPSTLSGSRELWPFFCYVSASNSVFSTEISTTMVF